MKPKPKKSKGCLETSISIYNKPDAFFRAGKMHLPVAFLPTAKLDSVGFAESKTLPGIPL